MKVLLKFNLNDWNKESRNIAAAVGPVDFSVQGYEGDKIIVLFADPGELNSESQTIEGSKIELMQAMTEINLGDRVITVELASEGVS